MTSAHWTHSLNITLWGAQLQTSLSSISSASPNTSNEYTTSHTYLQSSLGIVSGAPHSMHTKHASDNPFYNRTLSCLVSHNRCVMDISGASTTPLTIYFTHSFELGLITNLSWAFIKLPSSRFIKCASLLINRLTYVKVPICPWPGNLVQHRLSNFQNCEISLVLSDKLMHLVTSY
jgi:hypothetical protein